MKSFADLLDEELKRRGVSPIRKALDAGLNRDAIRSVLRGRVPSVDRAAEICDALGLEFYIGPPRNESGAQPAEHSPPSGESAAAIVEAVREEMASLRTELARLKPARDGLEDTDALVHLGDGFGESQETRHVEIVQFAAAAGGGAEAFEERVVGTLAFCRQWMDRYGLRPLNCVVIDIHGESMEPTLWDGASILIDRTRAAWRPGDIFVVRATDGVVVKRAGEDEAGYRQLLSDHPAWESVPYPDDAEIIGQVVWMARTLIAQ